MIEALEHPYLAPHALFIPLDFSSSESPSVRPRVGRPQAMAREGFRVVNEESWVAGSELGVVMRRGWWIGQRRGAQQGSTVLLVRVMSRAVITR